MARRVRIVFLSLLVSLVVCGAVWYLAGNARYSNVLIISCDALRPDHLSCYGYVRATSPNIDAFAEEGLLFTQAVSQASSTFPSLTSIHTSTYLHTHGLLARWDLPGGGLPFHTLAEILNENGYSTGFISGHGALDAWARHSRFTTFVVAQMKADEVTRRAIEWVEERRNEPFFLHIHYLEPHAPYDPPAPYDKLFVDDGFESHHRQIPIEQLQHVAPEVDSTDADYWISQYDGQISFADKQIGVLLKKLKTLGLDKKTIVLLTADHGESMGENGKYFGHGGLPFEAVIRVPLIAKLNVRAPKDNSIDEQVQLIDVAPTVLKLLNIEVPSSMEGKDLLPVISGQRHPSPYVFSGGLDADEEIVSLCVRGRGWKLMWTAYELDEGRLVDRYRLFNLESDAGEDDDLVDQEPGTVEILKAELHIALSQAAARSELSKDIMERERRERLKSLGYIQ